MHRVRITLVIERVISPYQSIMPVIFNRVLEIKLITPMTRGVIVSVDLLPLPHTLNDQA